MKKSEKVKMCTDHWQRGGVRRPSNERDAFVAEPPRDRVSASAVPDSVFTSRLLELPGPR